MCPKINDSAKLLTNDEKIYRLEKNVFLKCFFFENFLY